MIENSQQGWRLQLAAWLVVGMTLGAGLAVGAAAPTLAEVEQCFVASYKALQAGDSVTYQCQDETDYELQLTVTRVADDGLDVAVITRTFQEIDGEKQQLENKEQQRILYEDLTRELPHDKTVENIQIEAITVADTQLSCFHVTTKAMDGVPAKDFWFSKDIPFGVVRVVLQGTTTMEATVYSIKSSQSDK